MRQRRAFLNSTINIFAFLLTFIPNLILQKIFINVLGEDIRGLNGLYSSIIGWLSIIELGAGTAIIFSLYKPYADKDYSKIRAYIRFYQKFYIRIGLIIFCIGFLLTPFLQYFIENKTLDLRIVNIGFILYLLNSCITYLFSSKLCILLVAQEGYKISIGTTLSKIITILIQIVFLNIYASFIIFTLIQFIINCIYYILINIYIIQKYPWIIEGTEELEIGEKSSLLRNVKAMFMHKIGSLFVFGTDNIIISKYLGLAKLGYYSNYQLIINAIQNVISTAQQGLTASIGNLLVESDEKYACSIHNKIFFLNFWIASCCTIVLYNSLNQFIVIWIGEKFLLDRLTFIVIIINFYFYLMKGSIDKFKEASGSYYQDRFSPIIEGLVNLICSLILVNFIGLPGIFLGTLISNFTVLFWVKPYIVYKYVFKENVLQYFVMYFKYAIICCITLFIANIFSSPFKEVYNIFNFISNCLINLLVINIFYIILFRKTDDFKYYYRMCLNLIKT